MKLFDMDKKSKLRPKTTKKTQAILKNVMHIILILKLKLPTVSNGRKTCTF